MTKSTKTRTRYSTITLYELRYYDDRAGQSGFSKPLARKGRLVSYRRAKRIIHRLGAWGITAFAAPIRTNTIVVRQNAQ